MNQGTFRCMDTEPFRDVNSDWAQCASCGWIGPSEHTLRNGYGPLMFCPHCTCSSFAEYNGPYTIEFPVDLLFVIKSKLLESALMLGNKNFPTDSEYVKVCAECAQMTVNQLYEFLEKSKLLVLDENGDPIIAPHSPEPEPVQMAYGHDADWHWRMSK